MLLLLSKKRKRSGGLSVRRKEEEIEGKKKGTGKKKTLSLKKKLNRSLLLVDPPLSLLVHIRTHPEPALPIARRLRARIRGRDRAWLSFFLWLVPNARRELEFVDLDCCGRRHRLCQAPAPRLRQDAARCGGGRRGGRRVLSRVRRAHRRRRFQVRREAAEKGKGKE